MDELCSMNTMRRVFISCVLLTLASMARADVLAPSADPVTSFITVADSLARSPGDAGLDVFVGDNASLVGASVSRLLDAAFLAAQSGDAAGAGENVALAKRVVAAHEAHGGSDVARGLVTTYETWTASQRKSRARAMALEEESAAARKANDIPKAISLLDEARGMYEKIGDAHSVAVNWGTMGVTHFAVQDWDAVTKDYERALTARRAVEDRILEGRTLNGLGSVHLQRGDYAKSIEYYEQAVALRAKTGDLPGLGTSYNFLGNAYNLSGRYTQARDCYEKALPILESTGGPQQRVEILSGLAVLNADMGRMNDAETSYQRAIEIAHDAELGGPEAVLRRNLADNLRLQGRYTEALTNLDAAWTLLEANPDPAEQALLLSTRGTTYAEMGDFDAARTDFLAFADVAKTIENPSYAALAQRNIAEYYRGTGANQRGEKAAQEAVALAEKAGDARGYRDALFVRGDLLVRLGRYDDAMTVYQEALAQDTNDEAGRAILEDELAIAGVEALQGKTSDARLRLDGVRQRARAANLPYIETSVLFATGQSFEKENVDSAAAYYDAALAHVESQGAGLGTVHAGFLSGVRRHYYEEVMRFYVATYRRTNDAKWSKRAFATIEKAKARGLLDMLQATVAGAGSSDEAQLLDQLYALDPKSPDYAATRSALEDRYDRARSERVSSTMGGLANASTVIDVDALARTLPKKTVLLEYALGDSASFVWAIDRDGHEIATLPPRAEIEGPVRRLRDALARVDGDRTALLASARSAYELLIGPVAARVAKADAAIVVPDGAVFELPFEVLLTSEPVAGDWKQQPFLTRELTTLYAPSATVYASLKSKSSEEKFDRDLLAVGNPDFATLVDDRGAPLEPLPFAGEEVAAVSARVKADRKLVLTGADAREATIKRELETDAPRVVHLATHGLVDAAEPNRSSVALAAGDNEDGYFHTLEILATPTRSRLVVMSACESARGKVSRGEGVVGLSRAFLASGAGSVVASLWAVSDESTAELMKAFYDRMLGKKQSASRALNEARLALIDHDKFSHPFYWSPFVVTGTERSPW